MSRLTLQLLGPFAATYHGAPLRQFRTKAVQALLVYLACQPEAHPRESLMALLWPDVTRASAQNSLRQALYHLRQAIPEVRTREGNGRVPFVLSNRQIVQANPRAAFDLDVTNFERKLNEPPAQWNKAVGLYRDDFLCDFYLPDSARFEAWVLARRADLRRQVMNALDILIAAQMEQGAYGSAEKSVRRQLAINNLHEPAHRRLMEILVCLGRRNQALSHYEAYCCLLDDELGVGPAEECVQFIERVRDGVALPHTTASLVQPTRRHNLRPQPRRLVGRAQELDELSRLAADPDRRLINIVGPGGVGKSRLALAFAGRLLEEVDETGRKQFADGIFFVPMQPLRNWEQIIVAIARVLDLPLDGTERRLPQQQLLDYLREKELLLILDNFEHLLNEAAWLTEMLASAPGLHLFVTSRERLDLYSEQAYPLPGLAFPAETTDWRRVDLADYASATLFLACAKRTLPGYTPSMEEAHDIAELCRLVSGMPLALELAASWIDVLSPSQIVTEIRHNLDFLATEMRDVPVRHRSMRAVFDSTWSRLCAAEQTTLARLSVFRGDFTAPAATAVADAGRHTLARLVHKSILHHDPHTERYQIHELLRQYGERRLSTQECTGQDTAQEHVANRRHSVYYCSTLSAWEKDVKSGRQPELLGKIATEWDNIRAAWEWAATNCDTALLDQASESLGVYLAGQGLHQLGADLFGMATQTLRTISSGGTPQTRCERLVYARLLMWEGSFRDYFRQQARREKLAEESLVILEQLQAQGTDTRLQRAVVWQLISINHRNAWRHVEALQAAKNSLFLSQEVRDDWSAAGALEALGRSAIYLRRYEEGEEWLESCLALQRKLGNRAGEARALRWLATIAGSKGYFAKDEQRMRTCLDIYEELGNRRAVAQARGNVANDLVMQGRFEEAATLYAEGIATVRHLGIDWLAAYQLGGLANAKESMGCYEEAASLAREALALIGERKVILVRTLGLRILSTIAIVQKRYCDAWDLLEERQRILANSPLGRQIGLACQSYVATANQDYVKATRILQDALQGSDQAAGSLLWTLPAGALLLAKLGALHKALAIYAAALRRPYISNSCWFEDVVGKPLREMARSLSLEAVQEAEEQGHGWDIWQAGRILVQELDHSVSPSYVAAPGVDS